MKETQENRVTIREEVALDRPTSVLDIILQVVQDPRMDVEKVERLLAMQERVMADQRKTAFMAAMARLQEKLPQIEKDGRIMVGDQERSRYAKLETIDTAIKPLLAEEGFSFSFNEEAAEGEARRFSAKLSHKEGHSELKYITLPVDKSGSKNGVQAAGSTAAYAARYLIKMHLNIVERGADLDGNDLVPITEDQAKDLDLLISEVGADRKRFLKFMGVEKIEDILQCELGKAANALREKGKRQ